jgi:Uma2 family endonuclease
MSVAARHAPEAPPASQPELYRFTVPQYLKMAYADIFGLSNSVELIDGLVVEKMTRYPPHDGTVAFLNRWLARVLPEAWGLRCQLGLLLARSVPEPDFALVRVPEETYFHRHPGPSDTGLVIEVAEATLEYDRKRKGPLYAEARIPEYWIVNVVELQVEVYTQPRAGKSPGYRRRTDYTDTALLLALDGREIARLDVAKMFAGLASP